MYHTRLSSQARPPMSVRAPRDSRCVSKKMEIETVASFHSVTSSAHFINMQRALGRQDGDCWSSKGEIPPRSSLISDLGCLTVCCPISFFTMRPVFYFVFQFFSVGTADAVGRQEESGWTASGLCCSETAQEVDSAGAPSGHPID